jgi:hypothetical protein
MNAVQYISFRDELEKIAGKRDKRTFPTSRFLTSSPAHAGLGAIGGAGFGAARALKAFGGKLPAAILLGGLPGAAIGAGVGGGVAALHRLLTARAMRGRARLGGKALTKTERALLREAAKTK